MLNTKMQVNTGAMKNMLNRFFQRVDNVVYDLQTGGIGILNGDSSLTTLKKTGDNYELTNAPFNVSMSIPAFAVRTELDKVKTGDMIISDRGPIGYVIEKDTQVAGVSNAAYKMLLTNGAIASTVIPVNTVFGKEGVMVIQALNLFGGDAGGMNPMMMMAMMGGLDGGNGNGIDPMMLMMLSGGLGGGKTEGAIDPMMLMMLMGGMNGGNAGNAGGMNPMMMAMLMGGMNGGNAGGMNPMMMMAMMGGLDGGNAGAAPVRGNDRQTWNTK